MIKMKFFGNPFKSQLLIISAHLVVVSVLKFTCNNYVESLDSKSSIFFLISFISNNISFSVAGLANSISKFLYASSDFLTITATKILITMNVPITMKLISKSRIVDLHE